MNRTIEIIRRQMEAPNQRLSWSEPASVSKNGSDTSPAPQTEEDTRKTKRILFVQSSPLGSDSYSQRIADSVLNDLREQYPNTEIGLRDLSEDPPPHIDRKLITAAANQPEQRTPEEKKTVTLASALIDEVVGADIIVISVPIYNFGIPSTLKAWIDHVVEVRQTFSYTAGGPKGLLHGKRVILILAGGDLYSESTGKSFDFREPYLRAVLKFIGITDVEVVRVARPGAVGAAELDSAREYAGKFSVHQTEGSYK